MVNIDPEFGKWIPPLTSEEYSGLEKSILSEGCRDPLVVWGEIIVDGHNRYKICQKHGIPFNTVGISFATRDDAKIWILENQMARRNLHPIDRIALVKEVEPLIAARAKERHDATLPKPGEQGFREVQKSAPHEKTRDECARRVDKDPFSPYDLAITLFDYATLTEGKEICRVDVENKPKNEFPKTGLPEEWIRTKNGYPNRGASFLIRKTRKIINFDRDVYALYDNRPYPRIIWAPYKTIRDFGILDDRSGYGSKNQFISIRPHHTHLLHFGYRSLIEWCVRLKNQEVPP